MLEIVRMELRITSTKLDDVVQGLIDAAKADLRLIGIVSPDLEEGSEAAASDPLIKRAIILFAKAGYGYNDDAPRHQEAYDNLKRVLSLSGDYHAMD